MIWRTKSPLISFFPGIFFHSIFICGISFLQNMAQRPCHMSARIVANISREHGSTRVPEPVRQQSQFPIFINLVYSIFINWFYFTGVDRLWWSELHVEVTRISVINFIYLIGDVSDVNIGDNKLLWQQHLHVLETSTSNSDHIKNNTNY